MRTTFYLSLTTVMSFAAFVLPTSIDAATLSSFTTGSFANNTVLPSSSSVVYAVDIGSASSQTTSNGVLFGADDQTNITFDVANTRSQNTFLDPFFSNVGTSGDASFDAVLDTGRDSFPTGTSFNGIFTLNNLLAGTTYEVMVLVADTRDFVVIPGRTFQVHVGSDTSAPQVFAFLNGTPSLGGYWKGTFTADAVTQSLEVISTAAGRQTNAIVLSTVSIPEPTSMMLLYLGSVGLLAIRRRGRN